MVVRGKPCLVFDIEVFINVFHCTLYNTETNELIKFECSERKNEIQEMCQFFLNTPAYFVGYNNIHYDNPIINFCIEFFNNSKYTYDKICENLFKLSSLITSNDKSKANKWRRWKYAKNFLTIDLLTMLFSEQLRVSLKAMQVTMMYDNVQEFNVDWDQPLMVNQIDEMIQYNINDVMSTTELLNRCKQDIDLRINIEDQYHINCLSKDGVNTGMQILAEEYMRKTGIPWSKLKDMRTPANMIVLKEVILPFIKYDTPILQDLLKEMKSLTVSPGRKGYEKQFLMAGTVYSVGVGGIHSINESEIIKPKEDEMLIDSDIASLYPSMLLNFNFYPKHLGKEFKEVYASIRERRIKAKHEGDKVVNETLKLSLNGLSGNLQNEFSWCYDPNAVMSIRINGQLLLLMLAEKLVAKNCRVIQINTDGILYLCKKKDYKDIKKICDEWQELTGLVIEDEYFSAFYQLAINDYFGIYENGGIKEKGCFITKVKLGKGLTPKIIPKAVEIYFKDGILAEDTIRNCDDIKEFLMSEKTGKQWHVEYMGKEQQHINRFYASTNGGYLWKWKEVDNKKEYQNMLTASGVTLLNKFDNIPIKDRKINYQYYITEANKIIDKLKTTQLQLW